MQRRALLAALAVVLVARASVARADDDVLLVADTARSVEFLAALRVELSPREVRMQAVALPSEAPNDARLSALREALLRERAQLLVWLETSADPLEPPVVHVVFADDARDSRLPQALDVLEPRLFAIEVAALIVRVPVNSAPPTRDAGTVDTRDDTDANVRRAAARERHSVATQRAAPPRQVTSARYLKPRYFLRADVDVFALLGGEDAPSLGPAVALAFGIAVAPWLELDGRLADQIVFAPETRHTLDVSLGVAIRLSLDTSTLRFGVRVGAPMPLGQAGGATTGISAAIDAAWVLPISASFELGPRISAGLTSADVYGVGRDAAPLLSTLSLGLELRFGL